MPGDIKKPSGAWLKIVLFAVLAAVIGAGWWWLGDLLSLDFLAQRERQLKQFQADHRYLVYGLAFLIYAAVTGLSLPGAGVMSIVFGWYFGWLRGVILVSFASTTGAAIAFLLSRYLLHDFVAKRMGARQQTFNKALDKEGPLFLFTLRAVPLVPFFVVNAVMGLTSIRLLTFWWVSQLGMLPGTVVFVWAGSSFPSLRKLADEGVWSAFTTG
jgi:uncharacterized membrane protein YdjX (TVP38/TMEM64 family)